MTHRCKVLHTGNFEPSPLLLYLMQKLRFLKQIIIFRNMPKSAAETPLHSLTAFTNGTKVKNEGSFVSSV